MAGGMGLPGWREREGSMVGFSVNFWPGSGSNGQSHAECVIDVASFSPKESRGWSNAAAVLGKFSPRMRKEKRLKSPPPNIKTTPKVKYPHHGRPK